VQYLYLSVSDDDANVLHAVGTVAASHVSVTSLNHVDGAVLSTHLLSAPWIKEQHKYGTVLPCSVVLNNVLRVVQCAVVYLLSVLLCGLKLSVSFTFS